MARMTLPESLKLWKVVSTVPEENGKNVLLVSKQDENGSIQAKLSCYTLGNDAYNDENIEYIKEEAEFVKKLSKLDHVSNYIDIAVEDKPDKQRLDLFIITEDSTSLADIMNQKSFSENEVVNFGLQLSDILEKLEAKNIFHGNISPSNVFVTKDGRYQLGKFIDLEGTVEDLSYVAPEISRNEQADYTTDIYSLGLIMYAMCSAGRIPFEDSEATKDEAVKKRLGGAAVNAPMEGSEKLKSVVVIACQPENKNRWKNAGNLRNALASIKAELPQEPEGHSVQPVIAPESTDFDGNVFEEYSYDDRKEEPEIAVDDSSFEPIAVPVHEETAEEPAEEKSEEHEESAIEAIEAETIEEAENTEGSYQEPEIDNRVFDEYETQTRVFNIHNALKNDEKDYGDYFEDYDEKEQEKDNAKAAPSSAALPEKDNYDDHLFVAASPDDNSTEQKKGKKGLIAAIIIGIIILLALIGVFAYLAINNGLFSGSSNTNNKIETTEAATEATRAAATEKPTQPTTAAPTTEEPATEAEEITVDNVIGYGYYYAKDLLEEQGFIVEEGEYRYSDFYDEGYVISQSPDGESSVKKGSVITLDISLGPENSGESDNDTQEDDESSSSDNNSNSGSSYSSYSGNTSYMSQAEVSAMSRSELNIALNEIYARRGRIFTDPQLAEYFNSQSWYNPKYTAEEFSKNVVLNDYEEKNINLILNEQIKRGYR